MTTRLGPSPNATGSLYMVVGTLGYVINDALVRAATDSGMGVFQALSMRTAVVVVLLTVALRVRGESVTLAHLERPVVVRVVAEVTTGALFFAALVRLEFANAQAILMIVPFAVTIAAAVFLDERVTAAHYGAVALGFIGALAVIQPATDRFSGWSLVVVLAAAILVVREFATRRIDPRTGPLVVALFTAIGLTLLTGILSLIDGWVQPTRGALGQLALACGFLIVGYVFTIQTVRVGDLSVSAPFRYAAIIGALLVGLVAFDETPNTLMMIGCALIVLAGVITAVLDRRARRAPTPAVD